MQFNDHTGQSDAKTLRYFDAPFLRERDMLYYSTPEDLTVFKALPDFDIKFNILTKQFLQSGRLVYEYNPLHNLILADATSLTVDQETFYFKTGDICDFNISGSLLPLDLSHPVSMEIQPSYDGSVNLIMVDNKNAALLINSRFSVLGLDMYRIVDRKGSNDSNLYEEQNFKRQTTLYKTSNIISQIRLKEVLSGGKLPVGSYTFYLKYSDADGNETDVIAESGVISCFIGENYRKQQGGISQDSSNKMIRLELINLDTAYDYVYLYYVHNTSDYVEVLNTNQFKILDRYVVNKTTMTVDITGYESVMPIPMETLLIQYNLIDRQQSIAQIQSRLFQANLSKNEKKYEDLIDISLRFFPSLSSQKNIGNIKSNYTAEDSSKLEYADPLNTYYYLGYWNKEMYRFGVVYVYENNELSPVFNIRGISHVKEQNLSGTETEKQYLQELRSKMKFNDYPIYLEDGGRNIIAYDENKLLRTNDSSLIENAAGVINLMHDKGPIRDQGIFPLGIRFSAKKEVIDYLQTQHQIKGFFFVRQRRIPTVLFQGITQGYVKEANVPSTYLIKGGAVQGHFVEIVPADIRLTKNVWTSDVQLNNEDGATTRLTFESGQSVKTLTNNEGFQKRFVALEDGRTCIPGKTLYSPDTFLNTELFINLLTGTDFKYSLQAHQLSNRALREDNTGLLLNSRYYVASNNYNHPNNFALKSANLTLINDGHPSKYSGKSRFRGRQGIPEEAFRFESISLIDLENQPKTPNPDFAIRGYYSTYVGIDSDQSISSGYLVDVHVPDFDWNNLVNLFKVRINSSTPYYAITDRIDITQVQKELEKKNYYSTIQYRGDCYVGNFTQRINRNFQDPDVPLNDTILGNTIDNQTLSNATRTSYSVWYASAQDHGIPFIADNYKLVNRADVNALDFGHYITFKVCSNFNLYARSIDKKETHEYALTGNYRSFYPLRSISYTSETKIPESSAYNRGLNITLPNKHHYLIPDVPFINDLYTNRVMYSETHVSDAFRNGYRSFSGLNYQDYNTGWGSIMKVLEWRNKLMIIFEHGVGLASINDRPIVSEQDGTSVFVNDALVLPPLLQPLSETYGTQWPQSIVKTNNFVYGIDHKGKKIWRTDGETFQLISDFKVQKFLNDNITLTSREKTPFLGLRNIESHYNAFKEDLMFTYYDVNVFESTQKWNLCFNEQLNRWITRYDWEPVSSVNIDNIYFSYDREAAEKLALLQSSYKYSATGKGIVLSNYEYKHPDDVTDYYINDVINPIYRQRLSWQAPILTNSKYRYAYDIINVEGKEQFDNSLFKLINEGSNKLLVPKNSLNDLKNAGKYLFSIKVKLKVYSGNVELDTIYDIVHIRLSRTYYSGNSLRNYDLAYTTRFWKHGQAGVFDYQGIIKPTNWYGKQKKFEFEFVVQDRPSLHKLLNNLMVISNKVQPESFTFVVTTDSYTQIQLPKDVVTSWNSYTLDRRGNLVTSNTNTSEKVVLTTVYQDTLSMLQMGIDSWQHGRLKGNMHYMEDFWFVTIAPIRILEQRQNSGSKGKESQIKDKYIRVRVTYSGEDLSLITQINSFYTPTFS